MAPMPDRAKAGLWKLTNTLRMPAVLASFSHASSCFICSSYVGRVAPQAVCGELLIPGRSVIRHTHDQKLDHRAFDYHSPTGPSPRIKFSVPTGLVTPWLQRIFNRHADQLAQVGEAFVRDQREALLLYLVRHEERTPPIMLDRSATVAGLLLCLTAPA